MERELDAELQFHLDMQTAEYVRQGAAPEAARRAARQLFGGVEGIKDDVRDTWLTRLVETVGAGRPLRRAQPAQARRLCRSPSSSRWRSASAPTRAIFSVVNAVVLQPLPYERGEDLVLLQPGAQRRRQHRASRCTTSTTSRPCPPRSTPSSSTTACTSSCSAATSRSAWPPASSRGITSRRSASRHSLGRTFRADDDGHDAPATLILEPRVLAARVRRRSGCRRACRRDERSPAHDRRRAAGRADVPAAERRLHAADGVPLPHEPERPRPARQRHGLGSRAGAAPACRSTRRRRTWRRSGSVCRRPTRRPTGRTAATSSTAAPLRREFTRELRTHPAHPREHRRLRAPDRVCERRQPRGRADDAARPGACAAHGARREPRAAAAPVDHRKPASSRSPEARAALLLAFVGLDLLVAVRRAFHACARQRSGSTRRSCSSRWRCRF